MILFFFLVLKFILPLRLFAIHFTANSHSFETHLLFIISLLWRAGCAPLLRLLFLFWSWLQLEWLISNLDRRSKCCTLYSYTALLLKYSNYYFYCVRHSLVIAPVHICKIWNKDLLWTALSKLLFCILSHPTNLLSGIYTALFSHLFVLLNMPLEHDFLMISSHICILYVYHCGISTAAYTDRIITLKSYNLFSHQPFRPWYLEQWWSSWTFCVSMRQSMSFL